MNESEYSVVNTADQSSQIEDKIISKRRSAIFQRRSINQHQGTI